MMQQEEQFRALEKYLMVNPNHAVTFNDPDFGINYETNISHREICEKHGGLTNLFSQFALKGITKINVIPRKKNGSRAGDPSKPNFIANASYPPFILKIKPKETMNPTTPMATSPDLGLNGSDEIKFKAFDYQRVTKEYADIQKKYSKAKKKIKVLERQVIDYEHTVNTKKGLNGVVESVTSSPEGLSILAGLAEKLLAPKPQVPGIPSGLSEIKMKFMNTDDLVLNELARIAPKLNNEAFLNELETLLTKY